MYIYIYIHIYIYIYIYIHIYIYIYIYIYKLLLLLLLLKSFILIRKEVLKSWPDEKPAYRRTCVQVKKIKY